VSSEAISLSIRFRHPTMSVLEITSALGVEPAVTHEFGAIRRTPTGREIGGVYLETYWVCNLTGLAGMELSKAIASANNWVAARESFALRFLGEDGTIEYYVTLSLGDHLADELSPMLLAQCVKYRVKIAFEIFGSCRTD